MADDWFYARGGQKHGPLSQADLRRMATSGELLPSDLLWRNGMPQWVPASSARGLFSAERPPPMPMSPGQSSEETHAFPVVNAGPRTTHRPVSAKLPPGTSGIYLCAVGAFVCVLASSYDFHHMPRVINTSLALCYALLHVTLPVAIISRLKESTSNPLPVTRNALLYICVGCIAIALAIDVGTGHFIGTFQWLMCVRVGCNIVLTILLLLHVPRGLALFAIPATALLLTLVNGYSTVSSITVILNRFGRLVRDPVQLSRNVLSDSYLVMISIAALWYSLRQAFLTARNRQPEGTESGTNSQAAWPSFAGAIRTRAAQAARCARVTAERTTLVTATLPRAYAELGKAVYSTAGKPTEVSEVCEKIAALLEERQKITTAAHPPATTITEKAKKVAADAAALARVKAIDVQAYQAFVGLGESIYQLKGTDSGPPGLLAPIAKAIERREELNREIAELDQASEGQWLTPKRIALGGACILGLAIFLALGSLMPSFNGTASTGKEASVDGEYAAEEHDAGGTTGQRSQLYENGYRAGQTLAGNFTRSLASARSDAERRGTLEEIEKWRAGFRNGLESAPPNRQDLIDLARGKVDGFNDGLKGTSRR